MITDNNLERAESELIALGEDLDNAEVREIIILRTLLRLIYELQGIRSAIVSAGARIQ